jgi:hypothetical protein
MIKLSKSGSRTFVIQVEAISCLWPVLNLKKCFYIEGCAALEIGIELIWGRGGLKKIKKLALTRVKK